MGHEDDSGPLLHQILDGRQGRPDTGVVGHFALVQWHVKVHSHQDPFALDICVSNGFLFAHFSPPPLHCTLVGYMIYFSNRDRRS